MRMSNRNSRSNNNNNNNNNDNNKNNNNISNNNKNNNNLLVLVYKSERNGTLFSFCNHLCQTCYENDFLAANGCSGSKHPGEVLPYIGYIEYGFQAIWSGIGSSYHRKLV